jgi:hypothetical protein
MLFRVGHGVRASQLSWSSTTVCGANLFYGMCQCNSNATLPSQHNGVIHACLFVCCTCPIDPFMFGVSISSWACSGLT